jgi:SAM-dependent methyltransferase
MSFESLIAASQSLNASVEALAALGAELRLRRDGSEADPRVRELLQQIVHGIDPNLLEGVDAQQEAVVLAFITAFFRQAVDLLENPERRPGWRFDDPVVLQAQGQASRLVVRGIAAMAAREPGFREALQQPGVFLDVGTGVGLLAIEAARTWPALKIVGIDIWEPALALARRNLAVSDVADRVELRTQDVQHLADRDHYALAWLSGPFIPVEIVKQSLARIHDALEPGGWLVFGLYAPLPNLLGEALTNLRVVRGGGHPWRSDEVLALLRSTGFAQLNAHSPNPPIQFIVGRKD